MSENADWIHILYIQPKRREKEEIGMKN